MSKADITNVATLAAHLAQLDAYKQEDPVTAGFIACRLPAGRCAADAMKLQRLGRRTRRMFEKPSASDAELERQRILVAGNDILKPYGLVCDIEDLPFDERGFFIMGLPPNGLAEGRHELGAIPGGKALYREGFVI